jgi:hypothetical protein
MASSRTRTKALQNKPGIGLIDNKMECIPGILKYEQCESTLTIS